VDLVFTLTRVRTLARTGDQAEKTHLIHLTHLKNSPGRSDAVVLSPQKRALNRSNRGLRASNEVAPASSGAEFLME
jgi:hypothetical protein